MGDKLNVITGATGLLGSHIAEQLCRRGEKVRAMVRPTSDTSFLRKLNVELATGDLLHPDSLLPAFTGADIVYHCAARVSDWGSWTQFQSEVVETTGNLVAACRKADVGRLLHVSSISVYGHPKLNPGEVVSEEAPLGRNLWLWDHYAKAKILSEGEARKFTGEFTIVRPSWTYGPRDRVTIPRVIPALQDNKVPIIGSGDNLLNVIYVEDVAAGCILAAYTPVAKGQTYNLSSRGELTQRQMIDTLTDALDLPRVSKKVPYFLALRLAFLHEFFARLIRQKKPPTITRRAIYLIGRPAQFSIEKAKQDLGWEPKIGIREGVERSLDWYFNLS